MTWHSNSKRILGDSVKLEIIIWITEEILDTRDGEVVSKRETTILVVATCRRCSVSYNIHVDHVNPVRKYPELVFDVDNGICLCSNCHSLLSSKEEETDILEFLTEPLRRQLENLSLRAQTSTSETEEEYDHDASISDAEEEEKREPQTSAPSQDAVTEWKNLTQEAEALRRAGKHDHGVIIARRALEVAEKIFAPDHPNNATAHYYWIHL